MARKIRDDELSLVGFNPAQRRGLIDTFTRSEVYYTEPLVQDPVSPAAQIPIQVVGASDLFAAPDVGGNLQTNPDVDNWTRRAFFVVDSTVGQSGMDIRQVYCALRDDQGQPASVTLWCSLGAEIFGFLVYYLINDPAALAPFDGGTQRWDEWEVSGQSGVPREIPVGSGDWYKSNQRFATNQGIPQNATEWFTYIAEPDTVNTAIVRVMSVDEFVDVQEANSPTP